MPNRYELAFDLVRKKNGKAFLPFTVLGWPDKTRSLEIIKKMIDSGCTALELGIAFSDPIADGPILQAAAFETIDSGFSVEDAFDLTSRSAKVGCKYPNRHTCLFQHCACSGNRAIFCQD